MMKKYLSLLLLIFVALQVASCYQVADVVIKSFERQQEHQKPSQMLRPTTNQSQTVLEAKNEEAEEDCCDEDEDCDMCDMCDGDCECGCGDGEECHCDEDCHCKENHGDHGCCDEHPDGDCGCSEDGECDCDEDCDCSDMGGDCCDEGKDEDCCDEGKGGDC